MTYLGFLLLVLGVAAVQCRDLRQLDSGCPMICPMNYAPVCGSDGHTYSNMCALEVQECLTRITIIVVFSGTCDGSWPGDPLVVS